LVGLAVLVEKRISPLRCRAPVEITSIWVMSGERRFALSRECPTSCDKAVKLQDILGSRSTAAITAGSAFDLVSRDQTEVRYPPDGVIVVDRKVLLTEIGDRVSSFIRNDDNEPNLRRRRSLCRRRLLSRGYRRAPTCRGKKEEDMRARGGPPEEQYSPRTRCINGQLHLSDA
jgi:hypothetical protein